MVVCVSSHTPMIVVYITHDISPWFSGTGRRLEAGMLLSATLKDKRTFDITE